MSRSANKKRATNGGQLEKFQTHQIYSGLDCRLKEVIPIGFEPMAYSLEGCRSIQLSYGTKRQNGLQR
jgi:hypothetical protein